MENKYSKWDTTGLRNRINDLDTAISIIAEFEEGDQITLKRAIRNEIRLVEEVYDERHD